MSRPRNALRIVAMALGYDDKVEDADTLMSNALASLQQEAQLMYGASVDGIDIHPSLCSHLSRLKALETLFDNYMKATWSEPEAAEWPRSTER